MGDTNKTVNMGAADTADVQFAAGTLVFRKLECGSVISTERSIVSSELHELVTAVLRQRSEMALAPTTLAGLTDTDIDSMLGAL